jgi:hypothetical protein
MHIAADTPSNDDAPLSGGAPMTVVKRRRWLYDPWLIQHDTGDEPDSRDERGQVIDDHRTLIG